MKIRILKVSPISAHYSQKYDLTGTIGDVLVLENENGDAKFYAELSNCQYPPESGIDPRAEIDFTCVFIDSYEVVEE